MNAAPSSEQRSQVGGIDIYVLLRECPSWLRQLEQLRVAP
jgi:hypothetical protein